MDLDGILNDAGKAMKERVGTQCIEQFAGEYPGAKLDDFTTVPNAIDLPRISNVIDDDDLGQRTPTAPILMYHSTGDELEPVAGVDELVANYCSRGATVQYDRSAAGEHIQFSITSTPLVAAYLSDRFAGMPAPSNCPPRTGQPEQPGSSASNGDSQRRCGRSSGGRTTATGWSARTPPTGCADGGRDRLAGRGGDDCLAGQAGADRLIGGRGSDDLTGGNGADRIRARDGERDTVKCGRGRDRVIADRRDRVRGDCERVRIRHRR